MTRKGRKRLDIWLPEDHPIFSYPSGVRAKVAREWLDIGARLSNIDKNINEIKEKINELEKNPGSSDSNEAGFDAGAFAENIEKLFG
jgi:hypothetical protein